MEKEKKKFRIFIYTKANKHENFNISSESHYYRKKIISYN